MASRNWFSSDVKETKVHKFNNPIYEHDAKGLQDQGEVSPASRQGSKLQRGDTAIHIRPVDKQEELIESFYPNSQKLFRNMQYEYYGLILLILGNIIESAWVEPLDSDNRTVVILLGSLQIGLLFAIVLGFFVLTSHMLYVHLGRYDKYFKEFAPFFIAAGVELALMLGAFIYKIVLLFQNVTHNEIWSVQSFLILWIVQKIFLAAFWVVATFYALELFQLRHFDPVYVAEVHE